MEKVKVKCPVCKKERYLNKKYVLYETKNGRNWRCYSCAMSSSRGKSHYRWKGGRLVPNVGSSQKYIRIRLEKNDPYYCMTCKRGYVLEHRYVFANKVGRPLYRFEHVHHLDGNKFNNHPDNLELIDETAHQLVTQLGTRIRNLENEIKILKKRPQIASCL